MFTIREAAAEGLVPMPLADLIHERLTATVAKGRDGVDWSGFAREASEGAGLQPCDPNEQSIPEG